MTPEDLENELKKLDIAHQNARSKAIRDYCLANNKVNKGDIFTDHLGSILVEKIGFHYSSGQACCTYCGLNLTKKLEPRKDGSRRVAYQSNAVGQPQ